MGKIIYLEGSRAVGKTTLLKNLKQKYPNLVIIDGFARKDFSFDLNNYNDFLLNEKLYLECDIAEYNVLRNNNRTVIWVKGPYTDVYFTQTFPKTIKKDWNIYSIFRDKIEAIKKCFPDEIVYLDASEKTIYERYLNDNNKRETMSEWMKWLPDFRKFYINDCNAKVIKTDNLSPEEVQDEFERRVLNNDIGITSKIVERNGITYPELKEIGFSFIDYNIKANFTIEQLNNDFHTICNSGLFINQVHLPYISKEGILDTKEKYDEYIESCKRGLIFCMENCISFAVLHPVTFEKWMKDYGILNRYEANLFYIKELLSMTKNSSCYLAIENLPCQEFSSPIEFKKLFTDINTNNIGLCFDSGHAIINNYNYSDFRDSLGDKIKVLHLNSNDGETDLHLSIEEGIVDVKQLKENIILGSDTLLSSEIKCPSNMPKHLLIKKLTKELYILKDVYNDSITRGE